MSKYFVPEKAKQDLQAAATQAEQAAQQYLLKALNEQIEKLKKVEEKLSGWMGKNWKLGKCAAPNVMS